MKYVWFPLISVIEKRQKEISDNLASAKYAKMESDRISIEALACLKASKIKAQEIINHANTCKIQILNEAKCEADKEQKRILAQTKERIIYEKNCVIAELKGGIGKLVMEATEKIIEHSMNEKINHHLVDMVIKELLSSSKGEM